MATPLSSAPLLTTLLRRERLIGLAALLLLIALAWWYIVTGAGMSMQMDMASMPGMTMAIAAPSPWTPGHALLVFVMWWVMMIAMMLPSAAPMILLYGLVNARNVQRGASPVSQGIFALGYLSVWGAFSLLATALQWQLDRLALMSPTMATTSVALGGAVLVAAGVYQLTPWKNACLKHCRGPVEFLGTHWKPGATGAWRMGVEHGLYCLGCCWVLMTLLFYGGVMNLYWILGLTLYVLLEKLAPAFRIVSRLAGGVLIGWGALVLASVT